MLFAVLLLCMSGSLYASIDLTTSDLDNAIITLKKRLILEPINDRIYMELADLYDKKENYHESNFILKSALALKPNDLNIAHRYAISCIGLGMVDQAIETFQSILKRSPTIISVLYNIGYTLKMAGRVDQAIETYRKVLATDPTYDAANFALGHALLFKGDFENGWAQHELHLKKSNKNAELLRQWLSSNTLTGKKILLRLEGGMGDTIQFIRYAQILKNKGAIVCAEVQKVLIPLLSKCPYIDEVIPQGNSSSVSCHEWASLMSLPAIFSSNEQTIPKNIPYIYPDQNLVAYWKNYLKNDSHIKIGICWQADVFNDSSRQPVARRGILLQQFFKLAHHKNMSFYSLQQKEGLEQLAHVPNTFALRLFDPSFDTTNGSFMDTAAVMESLDLIITVDTAIAHLAGALGKPVWLLLPYATDWRWIAGRTDSPWYPSMKIFKQSAPFDWDWVMNQVDKELERLLENSENTTL